MAAKSQATAQSRVTGVAGRVGAPDHSDRGFGSGADRNARSAGAPAVRRPGESAARRPAGWPDSELLEDYRLACVSRAIDDREVILHKQSRAFFQISGAGHEALLLGLARYLRPGYDWFFPYYRDLALMLGLGVSPYEILLQSVGSADDAASGGRQMPSHWGFVDKNVVTQSSPTGSQCLPAVGCAEAAQYMQQRSHLFVDEVHADEVVYVSLGEGATSEGEFWESLNTACNLRLPVLYVVEDNGYAISVPVAEQSPAPISELVTGFPGLTVEVVDGCDYVAVRDVAERAVAAVRSGNGPWLLHARVTRPHSHSSADNQAKYRCADELAEEAERDPLVVFERHLAARGLLDSTGATEARAQARQLVSEAAAAALAAPRPDPESVTDHVWDLDRVTSGVSVRQDDGLAGARPPGGNHFDPWVGRHARAASSGERTGGEVVAMGEAIRRTLAEALEEDDRVRVFGEDVADAAESVLGKVDGQGGVFGTTFGLQRHFGASRCYNTPLAEANIVGRAVGQAVRGLRPCPEVQFFDYIWPAMQQIKSEAATIRWRSNGAFSCPMVLRVPIGGYITGGAIWHSQCGESIFAHIPGLFVAFPSRAADAAGLLRTALRAADPVLFLEHKHLLRQAYTKDPFPPAGELIPFGVARTVVTGEDLTIVTWGATVERCRRVAASLETADEASVEVIDLRTIMPWDRQAVADSVRRTGRLLVVHEDTLTAGFGAEVAAWAAQECFADLDAPVRRVAAKDTHVAYEPTLERSTLPQVEDIAAAVADLLAW
ncbi:MAG: dehydrogenase E1 component subunit alpha/beta [Actinomycetota bacterium]|nr:dehydrogenase E1 component subunit alpha/beta [Actinomycetota bacterium]